MKKIFGNSFLSISYYFVNLVLNMWITSLMISSLGKGVYSFYPLANNISGWMIIVTSAVNAMLARHVSISLATNDISTAKKYYTTALITDVVLLPVLLVPIIVISVFPNAFFNVPDAYLGDIRFLLFSVLLTVPINMLFTVPSVSWTAKDKLYLSYVGRLLQCIIKSGIVIFAYYTSAITLPVIGGSILFADLVYSFYILLVKRAIMPEVSVQKDSFDKGLIKSILKSGVWSSLMQLGNSLLFQCDLLVSNILLGIESAGVISITATIPNAITSIVTLLCSIFMPEQYKAYGKGDKKNVIKSVQNAQFIIGLFIGILVMIILNFGESFFDLWVPGNDSGTLLSLSAFYLIPLVVSATFRPVANISIVMNKMKFQAILNTINGLINVLAMICLVTYTKLGIYSVVITTATIVIIWYMIVVPIYVSKISGYSVGNFYKQPIINLSFIIITIIICKLVKSFFVVNGWISLFAACALCMILSLILPLIYQAYNKNKC